LLHPGFPERYRIDWHPGTSAPPCESKCRVR
jgi:hypothetical protein